MSAALIRQRRAQMLVHSHLYYVLGTSIVSDNVWQGWANELVELQRAEPADSDIGFYDPEFKDWDGATGMHLPNDGWVTNMANKVLALHESYAAPPPPAIAVPVAAPALIGQGSLF